MSRLSRRSFSSAHSGPLPDFADTSFTGHPNSRLTTLNQVDVGVSCPLARKGSTTSSIYTSTASTSSPENLEESIVTPSSDVDATTLVAPKIEELDESALRDFADLPEAAQDCKSAIQAARRRGRPRKHPSQELRRSSHARSKTGCLTCRKRKKKCDEARPSCENCRKNNVVCEGYEAKHPWRSGSERSVEKRRASVLAPMDLPMLVDGVDSKVDQLFFEHFVGEVSSVLPLTACGDGSNPWLTIIVPMAMSDRGIMHSLLCVSGSCLIGRYPDPDFEWLERQSFHYNQAITLLNLVLEAAKSAPPRDVSAQVFEPAIVQTLLLSVQTACAGVTDGSHWYHINGLKAVLTQHWQQFRNDRLRRFCYEFLIYHNVSSSITSFQKPTSQPPTDLAGCTIDPAVAAQREASTLLGVADGLFDLVRRIRSLRGQIRARRAQGSSTWCDSTITRDAMSLDRALREWNSAYTPGSHRFLLSVLYRQCVWIYLHRTTQLSQPHPVLKQAVDQALYYLNQLPLDDATSAHEESSHSMLLMPLFLLGCAAFDASQRPPIMVLLHKLHEWSGMGNIRHAKMIVEDVWALMDAGKEAESWDWEAVIAARGWDFFIS